MSTLSFSERGIHPESGTLVVASDGKQLGKVKEVYGDYVKVDARWARDYWLTCEEVFSADAEKVVLIIPSDEVNLYKRSKPRSTADAAMSVEAKVARRESMEREMMQR